ncbi:MAG: hypothetical protein US89_C0015G0041 [Candidatus Peregrinibacteria bacterium GW2011_GWF2_38_29]|nr:MAG: hypothetical protein US89_C0015G0041 [Candidatus Peregrinibacteria bacterium GW2011_GWF2_38_29]HBB02307.1 hypothetical protein [Candidatus Peregrinibacteria bacterium]
MKVHETGLSGANDKATPHPSIELHTPGGVITFEPHGRLKVLVADDVRDDVFFLMRALRQRGHETLFVDTPSAAKQLMMTGGVDVVISDLRMPVPAMGHEVMRHAIEAGIRTIAHTGTPDEIDPDLAVRLHAVIEKTADRAKLATRLTEALRPSQQE